MGATYGQFCPIAKAMELLDERWTMLIVRELLYHPMHFNELRRGMPRMSPSLLSKRLTQLERAGLVDRHATGNEVEYRLSAAGAELRPVLEGLAAWGVRWMGQAGQRELDPKLMMRQLALFVDPTRTPDRRNAIEFQFTDMPAKLRNWWLVIEADGADVCDFNPGHEVTLTVRAPLVALVDWWLGNRGWSELTGSGTVELTGPSVVRRGFPHWFELPAFATVPRAAVPITVG